MGVDLKELTIKPLTRGQIKELRNAGVILTTVEKLDEEARDEALDKIFKIACPELEVDEITPGQALELYIEIIKDTYAGDSLIKKLELQPGSIFQKKGSTAKDAKKRASNHKGTARKSKAKRG